MVGNFCPLTYIQEHPPSIISSSPTILPHKPKRDGDMHLSYDKHIKRKTIVTHLLQQQKKHAF